MKDLFDVTHDVKVVLGVEATVVLDRKGNVWYLGEDTKEFEDGQPLEPGAREVKFYCRGIGFVKGHDVTGGTVRLALTRIRR